MLVVVVTVDDDNNNNTNTNNNTLPVLLQQEEEVVVRIVVNGIWEPRISIPVDIPITNFNCSGKCRITITTHPIRNTTTTTKDVRNMVKIMTLSARRK